MKIFSVLFGGFGASTVRQHSGIQRFWILCMLPVLVTPLIFLPIHNFCCENKAYFKQAVLLIYLDNFAE